MNRLLIGLALLSGSAWAGRRSRGLGQAPFRLTDEEALEELLDLVHAASWDASYSFPSDSVDCRIRNNFYRAYDSVKKARQFSRNYSGAVGRLYKKHRCWGKDLCSRKVDQNVCSHIFFIQDALDDAIHDLSKSKKSWERACPGIVLPDVYNQKLDGVSNHPRSRRR